MLAPPDPAGSPAPADWIRERYRWDGTWAAFGVGTGFEAYVRVFHPYDGAHGSQTWAQVAAEHGKIMHASADWDEITTDAPWDPTAPQGPHRNSGGHIVGNLPRPALRIVCEVLRQHTSTPDECYFAVWEGWGWDTATRLTLRSDVGEPSPPPPRLLPIRLDSDAPRFDVLHRSFLLYRGATEQALEIGGGDYRENLGFFWEQSPTLMWPADHAWCLSTEIDSAYTVIGGGAALARDLVAAEGVEALTIEPDAPLVSTINQ